MVASGNVPCRPPKGPGRIRIGHAQNRKRPLTQNAAKPNNAWWRFARLESQSPSTCITRQIRKGYEDRPLGGPFSFDQRKTRPKAKLRHAGLMFEARRSLHTQAALGVLCITASSEAMWPRCYAFAPSGFAPALSKKRHADRRDRYKSSRCQPLRPGRSFVLS